MNDLASEYQQYQGTTANDREEAFENEDEEEMGGGGRLKMLQCTPAPDGVGVVPWSTPVTGPSQTKHHTIFQVI